MKKSARTGEEDDDDVRNQISAIEEKNVEISQLKKEMKKKDKEIRKLNQLGDKIKLKDEKIYEIKKYAGQMNEDVRLCNIISHKLINKLYNYVTPYHIH